MYIDRVVLKNIRGFDHLDFDLCRGEGRYAGWTVFTGDNGAGKSTLLKAIAVALIGKDAARSLQPSFHRWIRDGAVDQEAHIELTTQPERGVDDFAEKGGTGYGKFAAMVILKDNGKETSLELPGGKKARTVHSEACGPRSPMAGSPAATDRSGVCSVLHRMRLG